MVELPSPSYNDDPKSFAYPSVHQRWPTILEGSIEDVKDEIKQRPECAESGKEIVVKLEQLLADLRLNKTLDSFSESDIKLNPDLKYYNESLVELNRHKKVGWLTGPWLNLECYLYQVINLLFIGSKDSYWHKFDVFEKLKSQTFAQSETGVLELCKRYEALESQLTDKTDSETLKVLFEEFIDISLWGNATDLSLLAGNVTLEDIKSVQGEANRKKNEANIVVNDLSRAWEWLFGAKTASKRIDIILDNSGFEVFADLALVLFVLDSGIAGEVHLHCKEIPWFVSDVLPKDYDLVLSQLEDPRFFPEIHLNQENKQAIDLFHHKLVDYRNKGKIVVKSDPFWTLDHKFWAIPKFDKLYHDLLQSNLIILKGDLNYRKLTGDMHWDPTTPFEVAIQDLAASKLPLLSLRTCKADVVVGLKPGLYQELCEKYKAMGNDRGEFWSTSGKWAVISFSSGTPSEFKQNS